MKYARIFINQVNRRIDQPYDYQIPDELENKVRRGVRVAVPFSRGRKLYEGFVIETADHSDYADKIRPIKYVIDDKPVLTETEIKLCLYICRRYCSLFYEALTLFTAPVKIVKKSVKTNSGEKQTVLSAYRKNEKIYTLTEAGRQAETAGKVMRRILDLLKHRDYTDSEMKELLGNTAVSRKKMIERGWIRCIERPEVFESGVAVEENPMDGLSGDAQVIYQKYIEHSEQKPGKPAFFSGLNHNDAFDFYLAAAAEAAEAGQSALILYPEIVYAEKFREKFYRTFGNAGAIYHGDLPQAEKYRIFSGIRSGQIRVILGSRTALFLPYINLGLIVCDEINDLSFYSDMPPHYHVGSLVRVLSKMTGADLLIRESVPSVAFICRVNGDTAEMLSVDDSDFVLPSSRIVDMQAEMKSGNIDFMSYALKSAIDEVLKEGKSVLLMHNRRGYNSYVFCRDCGTAEKCETCGTAYKTRRDGSLVCPICGRTKPMPKICPKCGSRHIRAMGLGIDQVCESLKSRYPDKHILKLDAETVGNDDFHELNKEIAEGAYDIIVGTRMLLKPFDYPKVGLAAVILADSEINGGYYDSAEAAFSLYARFLGLSAERRLIQTYEPDNPTILAIAGKNAGDFYSSELTYRKMMAYPPFGHLYYFFIFGPEDNRVRSDAENLYRELQSGLKLPRTRIYQPSFRRIRQGTGDAEWQIVVKTPQVRAISKEIRRLISEGVFENIQSKTALSVDPPIGR